MKKAYPDWVTRAALPGGFRAKAPSAGGPLSDWESELLRRRELRTRADLNSYFQSSSGREELGQLLKAGAFRIRHPEEGALMVAAYLEDDQWIQLLRPFFSEIRFYPEPLPQGYQDTRFGLASRISCGDCLRLLQDYRLPLDVLRKRESLSVWRPLKERLLKLLAESVVDGWPLQSIDNEWKSRAVQLLAEIEEARGADVVCCFPMRADSDFSHLAATLEIALYDPELLTGKHVGRCKAVLDGSIARWGRFDEPGRSERVHVTPGELPGAKILLALGELSDKLSRLPSDKGWEADALDTETMPPPLRRKALQAREGTLEQLVEWKQLTSIDTLSQVAPQLVAGTFTGETATLLSRCYRAHTNHFPFERLPWLSRLWHPPTQERLFSVAKQILECWWRHFPERPCPFELKIQLETLSRWSALKVEPDFRQTLVGLAKKVKPRVDYEGAVSECRRYRERQESISHPKPYQRQQKEKRVQACLEQEELFRQLLLSEKRPRHTVVEIGEH